MFLTPHRLNLLCIPVLTVSPPPHTHILPFYSPSFVSFPRSCLVEHFRARLAPQACRCGADCRRECVSEPLFSGTVDTR